MNPPVRSYGWMVSSAVSFATMGALSILLATDTDWRFLVFVRAALMLLFAGLLGWTSGTPFVFRGTPMLWMRSLVGSLSMILTYFTLTHLPFSEATTLIKSYPIWVAVLSWAVLKERASAGTWIAIAVGVAGVVLIAQPHFQEARVALATGILSSFCTAVVMLTLNRLAHVEARAIVTHFGLLATIIGAGVFLAAGREARIGDLGHVRPLSMLLGMGVMGTVGQIALTRAFALGDPARVSVVGLSELLFSAAYDRILWNRTFGWMTLAGMALVAAPTAWLLATSHRSGPAPSAETAPAQSAATTPEIRTP